MFVIIIQMIVVRSSWQLLPIYCVQINSAQSIFHKNLIEMKLWMKPGNKKIERLSWNHVDDDYLILNGLVSYLSLAQVDKESCNNNHRCTAAIFFKEKFDQKFIWLNVQNKRSNKNVKILISELKINVRYMHFLGSMQINAYET